VQRIQNATSGMGAVFYVTAAIALAFVVWGVFFTENLAAVAGTLMGYFVADLGWLYLVMTTFFLAFVVYLAFSRYGKIRLGKEGEEPEFGRFAWFAMLFQAGMGIGLIFWAVSEPTTHFADPPHGGAVAGTTGAAQLAMQYSFFHWSLHPWGVYAVVGLAMAYVNFRRDRPHLVSSVFYPLLGDRVNGPIGKAIDIVAVVATLFGVAVSLGLGTVQIGAGFDETFGIPNAIGLQLIIIAVTAAGYMISASTPVSKGVNYLSQASIYVAAVLLIFFLVTGPTVTQINAYTQGIGDYLGNLIPMSFTMNSFDADIAFLSKFTIFHFATWIAWAPFVGAFIARISRGRTIREFALGVLIAPTLVSCLWFAVFGGAAIDLDQSLGGAISAAASSDPAVGLFVFLQYYPLPVVTSLVTIFLLWIFFVAGADAGTIVLGSMSTGGVNDPSTTVKLAWGVAMAAFAAILLVAGQGGIEAVQQASVLSTAPFGIIMLFMCWALYKSLKADARQVGLEEGEPQREPVGQQASNPGE
jgi:glycine betaine transporter